MCWCFVCMYIYVPCACQLPSEDRRGCQIPWNWNYSQLWTNMWVLEKEPRFSGRVVRGSKAEPFLQPSIVLFSIGYRDINFLPDQPVVVIKSYCSYRLTCALRFTKHSSTPDLFLFIIFRGTEAWQQRFTISVLYRRNKGKRRRWLPEVTYLRHNGAKTYIHWFLG